MLLTFLSFSCSNQSDIKIDANHRLNRFEEVAVSILTTEYKEALRNNQEVNELKDLDSSVASFDSYHFYWTGEGTIPFFLRNNSGTGIYYLVLFNYDKESDTLKHLASAGIDLRTLENNTIKISWENVSAETPQLSFKIILVRGENELAENQINLGETYPDSVTFPEFENDGDIRAKFWLEHL